MRKVWISLWLGLYLLTTNACAASGATATDGFETGDFSALPWEHPDIAWQVTAAEAYTGTSSARSAAIGDDTSSTLRLTCDCADGEIRFAVKVSSEAKYDELVFRMDGQDVESWSGERAWTDVDFPVAAGRHTFSWTYAKDKSKSVGQDAAWIDNVSIPVPQQSTRDGFESGDFSALSWQQVDTAWQTTSVDAHTGTYSARSGPIGDGQTSGLSLTHDGPAGSIAFAVKVSSEAKYDELVFTIDDQETGVWSGELAWTDANFPVTAGAHTYTWTYAKDKSKSVGQDAAWLDDVVLPGSTDPNDPNDSVDPNGPTGMVFAEIPGGSFEMGDHFKVGYFDELPVHTVTLDGFQISVYETTNTQYAEFLNAALGVGQIEVVGGHVYAVSDSSQSEPYFTIYPTYSNSQITYTNGIFSVRSRDGYDMSDHPVTEVSWYGAQAFCDYYGYCLPTEAEWEYAARGGYHDPYYKYPWGSNEIDCSKANHHVGNGVYCNPLGLTNYPYTSPVGHYGGQGRYGLCDMAGNVWEWCADLYKSDYYNVSPTNNPQGPSEGLPRVLRGGSWYYSDYFCRAAYRYWSYPNNRFSDFGFRVCIRSPLD